MIGGVLFLVIELYPAASEVNMKIKFNKLRGSKTKRHSSGGHKLKLFVFLSNAVLFYFHSYDPITKKFCFDERIMITNMRPGSLAEMVEGAYFFYTIVTQGLGADVHSL